MEQIKTRFIHTEGKGMKGSYSGVDLLNCGDGGIIVGWGRKRGKEFRLVHLGIKI